MSEGSFHQENAAPAVRNVGGDCYGQGMACFDLATGEPCKGLDRFPAGRARDKVELAAALVGAVAGVCAGGGFEFPERRTEAWRALEKRLEAVTKAAATLSWRIPRIRDPRQALAIARGLDALLCNISSGYNALELAIGDGLAALDTGRRAMDLGHSNVGDYAREELGLNASTAAKKARLARKLRDRPKVREALRRGEITPRKAEILVPAAVGDQQTHWIVRAKTETVRALKKAVKGPPDPDDEELMSVTAAIAAGKQAVVQEGLRWGGIVLGQRSTKAQRVEAWGQEYYGGHPVPPEDAGAECIDEAEFRKRCDDEVESLKERLEHESRLWAELAAVDPLQAIEFSGEVDPWRIDAELKRLVELLNRWDEVFGHIAALFKRNAAWEPLDFVNFGHYCEERLGMARRTVLQRVALEDALRRIPLLRQALREKAITYEKARVIARHWDAGRAQEMRPLIAMAQAMTCVELREALAIKAEEQMCAHEVFTLIAPPDIFDLLKDTLRMARAIAKRSISLGMCLVEMAEHFVVVWKAHVKDRMTKRKRIFARDRHRCQVPGCSRPAVQQHHLEFRSHGGSDDESNQLSLCAAHHLFGIHDQRMSVTGKAPDELVWRFGLRRSWAQTAVP
jgi:hypothetical protein